MAPVPKPGVLDIAPYIAGRAPAVDAEGIIKLSSNESPLGASPLAKQAYLDAADTLELYPEGTARELREAIGEAHGLDPAHVICGAGSDEILHLLARAYLQPGDEVLFSRYGFIVYEIAALASSAIPVAVPEPELRVDVEAMLRAVTPKTRLVYLANPNNPTGSYLTAEELRRLHAGLPKTALLVIDAAYAEYIRRGDYISGQELVDAFGNVVMTRTFSKIYGLASLRVGWAYCPPAVADTLNRVRGPFNVSTPAQRAAAAALIDREHAARAFTHNETWRAWLTENIRALGLRVDDSVGNFLLIHFPAGGAHDAKQADAFLNTHGLILRPVANYGLPDCLRLTVGTEEANRRVVKALREFLLIRDEA